MTKPCFTLPLQLPSAFSLQPSAFTVGTLHSPACLDRLAKKDSWKLIHKLDFLEVRLDRVREVPLLQPWPRPMIVTARHPEEGGAGNLSSEERREMLEKALSWASVVDVELRSFHELDKLIELAHEKKCQIVASFHDFEKVPPLTELEKMLLRAEKEKVTFLKIAVTPNTKEELQRLLFFQKESSSSLVRVATMGMGFLGVQSRKLLAEAGAALKYGWVYHPQVIGQWSVEEMLEHIITVQNDFLI